MTRTWTRSVLLALIASILVVVSPAGAQPPETTSLSERSHLEDPDPVTTVRLSLTGSDMLDVVTEAGFDISHGLERVPTGIEVEHDGRQQADPLLAALRFSVDTAGNIEKKYDPDKPGKRDKYRRATITIGN